MGLRGTFSKQATSKRSPPAPASQAWAMLYLWKFTNSPLFSLPDQAVDGTCAWQTQDWLFLLVFLGCSVCWGFFPMGIFCQYELTLQPAFSNHSLIIRADLKEWQIPDKKIWRRRRAVLQSTDFRWSVPLGHLWSLLWSWRCFWNSSYADALLWGCVNLCWFNCFQRNSSKFIFAERPSKVFEGMIMVNSFTLQKGQTDQKDKIYPIRKQCGVWFMGMK